ncbi:ABC transporter permease [Nocardioides fonticola]|uniref:ABC transporter permease n=1 Tax=Nocardioides fonticola TaxID=450363 RepID=A0ABP7XUF7_9ACTN
MADVLRTWGRAGVDYVRIARMWGRALRTYRASFWMLVVSSFVTSSLDFVALAIVFTHLDRLAGFDVREIAFLYGASGLGIGVADLLVGRVERLGAMIRTGALDAMLTRPVPLLVQVCADEFALRRITRIVQAGAVFAWGCWWIDWTPSRAALTVLMVVCSAAIFIGLFLGFATVQFWTQESAEVANAFTYGGNTITQYPLSVYPGEVVKALTFGVPVAFVSWYPALEVLGRRDPFGSPAWFAYAPPVAALAVGTAAALAWRAGVRHYRSTGS